MLKQQILYEVFEKSNTQHKKLWNGSHNSENNYGFESGQDW